MRYFIGLLIVGIIGMSMGHLVATKDHRNNITEPKAQILCEYSKYATSDAKIINGNVYCRASENSYQALRKPTEVIEK